MNPVRMRVVLIGSGLFEAVVDPIVPLRDVHVGGSSWVEDEDEVESNPMNSSWHVVVWYGELEFATPLTWYVAE